MLLIFLVGNLYYNIYKLINNKNVTKKMYKSINFVNMIKLEVELTN